MILPERGLNPQSLSRGGGTRFLRNHLIAEDDKVVTMVSGRGTHKGELMGLAPTEKEINTTVICISQLEEGKIVKDWELVDLFGILKQLGALPEPEPQK